ncbi:response regulator transcription factor [Paludibaculum fermentans]|uniref:response regulator transcription factor n=1 Tax=Paludibaculum fermentans TaxID=1473598 RepID=UPI003EB6D1CE
MNQDDPIVSIVDDDISVQEALTNLLRSVGLKAQTFSNAQDFLSSQRPDAPGCLVLDVRLPGMSGLDLQLRLTEAQIGIPIIFITGHGDIRMSVRAMKAGAVDFLTKPFRAQELLDAVQESIERDRAARKQRSETAELRARYESLSSREREVMGFVVRGLLSKQIASRLGITLATVKLHRGAVMNKMRVNSLADLVRIAQALS